MQETLRWLKLEKPHRRSESAPDEVAAATSAEPLPALARNLAEGLDCAVLAMRYPVGDAFAIEFAGRFYRALFEQRRSLPAALQLAIVSWPPYGKPCFSRGWRRKDRVMDC